MPHFHDMGLVGGLLFPLIWQMPSTQMSPLMFLQRPADYLQIISAHPSVMSGGPAFFLQYLMDRVDTERLQGTNLASWTKLFCGGEPIPAGLFEDFAAHFSPLGFDRRAMFATYGMAETTLYTAGGYAPEQPENTPSLFEGCRLSSEDKECLIIADPDSNHIVEDGKPGEICVKGKSIGKMYGPDLCKEAASTSAYYRTGDIGMISRDHLYITGRIKDVLIANGQNFMASEIEWFSASAHPQLNHLAAAAYQLVDTPDCFLEIELKSNSRREKDITELEQSLIANLKAQFGLHFKEVRIVPRGTLPRTSSGKIKRQAVKQNRQRESKEVFA
jgi:acyl-CoA synthetase (AMP-forming)/AMP-acid ligase II